MKLFAVLFLLAVIIEGVLSSIPLTFIVLLTFLLLSRKVFIFYLAFTSGIILDILSLREVGVSSIYFLTIFLAVLLYERKFEIQTPAFVTLASFLGSLGFLFITTQSTSTIVLQAIAATCIALIIFKLYGVDPETSSG